MNTIRYIITIPGLLLLTACAGGGGLGQLGDILGTVGGVGGAGGAAQSGEIQGEIDQVDTRNQRIYVRTQAGQSGSLVYDQQTEVIYQQQLYPVTALERGDLVTIQAQQGTGNELYAQRIHVEQSVQERTGSSSGGVSGTGQVQQLEGRVGQVDYQRGVFELQTQRSGTVVVSLPYNPPETTEEQFNRLRTGDTVRLEGEWLGNGRVQLHRFL